MTVSRPCLSVVILTWNSLGYCLACLKSLDDAGWFDNDTEIVLIDNGSSDNTAEIVAAKYPKLLIAKNPRNRGVGPARNQGVRLSHGEAILFLDVDTVVAPGAIEILRRCLNDPEVGVVGPRLVSVYGQLQHTGRLFPTLPGKLGRRLPTRLLQTWVDAEEMRFVDQRLRRDVDYVIGACQMIRREVFDSIGLLDEKIFYGPEDVDFCLRAKFAGWRVVYEPRACIQHAERRLTRRFVPDRLTLRHAYALGYYFMKHRYLLSRRRLYSRMLQSRREGTADASPY